MEKDIRLIFLLSNENENLSVYIIIVEKKHSLFYNHVQDRQYIWDQLRVFCPPNKPYINYNREKP